MALVASALVRTKSCSRICVTLARLWPLMAAISGTEAPASARAVTAVWRRCVYWMAASSSASGRRARRPGAAARAAAPSRLTPSVVEAVRDGRQPKGIRLGELTRVMPKEWTERRHHAGS